MSDDIRSTGRKYFYAYKSRSQKSYVHQIIRKRQCILHGNSSQCQFVSPSKITFLHDYDEATKVIVLALYVCSYDALKLLN